jgi:ATP-binding cassette subfamily C protein/ATP-binding cassette subfamily C protein EexD
VHEWPSDSLGAHLGYLPQDVQLFGGTVRDNITRLRDDWTSEGVLDAARLANVDTMIKFMPKGYETIVGSRGTLLSGGQMQRVGLARALYGDIKLVVLDEPNANLDAHGEQALASAIEELKRRGVTVVVILHRPNILKVLDYVMVLADGKVQKIGSRAEMLAVIGGPGGVQQPDNRAINVVSNQAKV